jgi:hypothetical protein
MQNAGVHIFESGMEFGVVSGDIQKIAKQSLRVTLG